MLGYIAKRLLGLLPTLVIVGLLVFLFVHLLPGDQRDLHRPPPYPLQLRRRQDLDRLGRSVPAFIRIALEGVGGEEVLAHELVLQLARQPQRVHQLGTRTDRRWIHGKAEFTPYGRRTARASSTYRSVKPLSPL